MIDQMMEPVKVFHHQVDIVMKKFNELLAPNLQILVVEIIHHHHRAMLVIVLQLAILGKPDLHVRSMTMILLLLIYSAMNNPMKQNFIDIFKTLFN
jgi:hypothetical protein